MAKPEIVMYYDVVSPYSYFAFETLTRQQKKTQSFQLILKPFFLGGVMQATGNQPPAMLPARSKYLLQDIERNSKYFDIKMVKMPKAFPINTLLNQRVLTCVSEKEKKGELPPNTLENLSRRFWQMYWAEDTDISTRPIVEEACAFVGISHEQTQKILEEANSANIKDLLKGTTEEAVAKGSFGAPTIIVKCSNLPKEEFFFGSDRFHILFPMIGLQWNGPQNPVSKL